MAEKSQNQEPGCESRMSQPLTQVQVARPQVAMPQAGNWQHQVPQVLPNQPTTVYQVSGQAGTPYEKYNSKTSKKLGIVQLVAGAVAFIVNVAGIVVQATKEYSYEYGNNYYWMSTVAYNIGSGIWCSIFIFLSGSFALCAATRKTACTIITHLVLSIFASIFSFVMMCMAGWAVGHDAVRIERNATLPIPAMASMCASVVFLMASLMAFVACIWSSTLCCKVVCCCDTNLTKVAVSQDIRYMMAHDHGRPEMIILDRRGRPLQVTQIAGALGGSIASGQPQIVTQGQNIPMETYVQTSTATPPSTFKATTQDSQDGPHPNCNPPPYSVSEQCSGQGLLESGSREASQK